MITVGKIGVHEFITLDGVIGDPSWSCDYSFDPKMGEAIGELMGSSEAILLGRRTYQEFAPAWSTRSAEEDPGAPFMNEAPKIRRLRLAADRRLEQLLGPWLL
jgi:dihydrofolate reductase